VTRKSQVVVAGPLTAPLDGVVDGLAVGAPVPWQLLILVWAAGAGVSSLGLTPGGSASSKQPWGRDSSRPG
jgi:hypothetical protein